MRVGDLVKGHAVKFEGLVELPHLVADVGHVDLEAASIREHPVRSYDLVGVHRLVVHLVRGVLTRQIQQHLDKQKKLFAKK